MNMQPTRKLGLLAAFSLGALGAMSAPAFSESTEFRRGYEQGYEDARKGRKPRYDYANGSHGLTIHNARYGVNGEVTCSATDAVQRIVDRQSRDRDGNRTYTIPVSNRLCGDPAPNRRKGLIVKFRCDNGEIRREQAEEGSTLRLRCR